LLTRGKLKGTLKRKKRGVKTRESENKSPPGRGGGPRGGDRKKKPRGVKGRGGWKKSKTLARVLTGGKERDKHKMESQKTKKKKRGGNGKK